jgi:hypothetical protein
MKKSYSRHPLMRTIAGVAAASMICLSVAQPVFAFDSIDGLGVNGDAQIYGFSLTGNFEFNKVSVNSFAYTSVEGMTGSYDDDGFVSFSNGMIKTDLPLLTFGNKVQYPGILYNHDGTQFFDHVAAAAEGDVESGSLIWAYVLGGLAVAGIIYTISEDTGNDTPPAPVVETVVVEEAATAPTTDATTVDATTEPAADTTVTVPASVTLSFR